MNLQTGLTIMLLAAACGGTTTQMKGQGGSCRRSTDCAAPLECNHIDPATLNGQCEPPCQDTADCLPGTSWNEAQCQCLQPVGAVGDACGGNIANPPPPCQSGLVCENSGGAPAGDVGGRCTLPAENACQPNGSACTHAADCCSGNCITRTSPGYCCEPGGCP